MLYIIFWEVEPLFIFHRRLNLFFFIGFNLDKQYCFLSKMVHYIKMCIFPFVISLDLFNWQFNHYAELSYALIIFLDHFAYCLLHLCVERIYIKGILKDMRAIMGCLEKMSFMSYNLDPLDKLYFIFWQEKYLLSYLLNIYILRLESYRNGSFCYLYMKNVCILLNCNATPLVPFFFSCISFEFMMWIY